MTSTRAIADELENALDYLVDSGLAIYRRPIRRDAQIATWLPNSRSIPFLPVRDHHSIDLYRHWVSSGHYSAILFDASILQVTAEFARGVLVGHRFAYVPAPVSVDPEWIEIMPILDVVDEALSDVSNLRLATSVRVEYDPLNAREDHPATHLSFNDERCRIACVTPMRLGMFLSLVFRNFYSDVWQDHDYLHGLPMSAGGPRTISDVDRAGLHVAWPA